MKHYQMWGFTHDGFIIAAYFIKWSHVNLPIINYQNNFFFFFLL